jgi:serine/threonine protein kinase
MNLASDVASIFLRRSSNAPPKPILRPFAGIENASFVEAMRDYKKINPIYEFKKSNYKFIAQLGKGSYAKVYSAQQLESGALVAVKEIDKTRMRHREERMKTEIEILIKLDHPNLLTLIDWGIGKANVYLVVELAQGGDLFDVIIDKGNFFEWEAAIVMNSLLSAIEYLHERGIVHRGKFQRSLEWLTLRY